MHLFRKPKGPGYDPNHEIPAIRKSICTGEAVAGFSDRATGKFTEVMLVRTPKDLEDFKTQYGVTGPIKTIY